ncbi:MAG: NADH-quinone oxidoreductase subunit H [Eggerthellaceae bacterium]|nr:NADH-quinone oxidoreductase subunit H [Eggerthellaceae bacterium]
MDILKFVLGTIGFVIAGPIVGCLLAGIDRKLSAKMQGRVGPPLLQPFYDVRKLFGKEKASVNKAEGAYVGTALFFAFCAGGVFFTGGNILMCVFIITLSSLMFIVAAFSTRSPFAEIGASRECIQVMSYEPMILFMAITHYMVTGNFNVSAVFDIKIPVVAPGILVFLGLLFVLTIKLRKSPFDVSMSHHAHQEIVRGVTTEMSGSTLALVEIMHWCETVLFLGWVAMFFIWINPASIAIAIVASILIFLFEIWVDNNFARVKWQTMFEACWIVSLICGVVNILALVIM